MTVLVLGSTGMLGQAILSQLQRRGLNPIGVARGTQIPYDAMSESFESLMERPGLQKVDYIVNCIGWIPQKASLDDLQNKIHARRLNDGLIEEIASYSQAKKLKWIQIGTDCIYDGKQGQYDEDAEPNPTDLYGQTKLDGEKFVESSIFVRCSIVGSDSEHHSGLYEWSKLMLDTGQEIRGFTNHFWNGVTTNAFARLVAGLIQMNWSDAINVHWIPEGNVAKAELIQMFCEYREANISGITPCEAPSKVDRTLATNHENLNSLLWEIAGYGKRPSIEELVEEMVKSDRRWIDG